jgi:UDPglucose 6-dehydrogenase
MKPDRIVLGADTDRARELVRELYEPFNRNHDRLIVMDVRSAELTKYAANAMLATKISFMNELAGLAERLDADIERVRIGIGSDPRIGYEFIYPGCGFGGSCFPKDVRALVHIAGEVGAPADLIAAVQTVNERQKSVLFAKLSRHFAGDLRGKRIALWGLAFKPNTDDMREAPSRVFIADALAAGAEVTAYDPVAQAEAQRVLPADDRLRYSETAEAAVVGADAVVIATEWREFRSPDFEHLRAEMRTPVVVDGRNLYDPRQMRERGFAYYAVGRGL